MRVRLAHPDHAIIRIVSACQSRLNITFFKNELQCEFLPINYAKFFRLFD